MDHEKLDVYRVSLEVVKQISLMLKRSKEIDRVIRDQILRSSTSIVLNIAEGTGKRSVLDRKRYYEISRGSAMETAAALDIMVVSGYVDSASVAEVKVLLRRVVAMLTRMTEITQSCVRETEAEYLSLDPDVVIQSNE